MLVVGTFHLSSPPFKLLLEPRHRSPSAWHLKLEACISLYYTILQQWHSSLTLADDSEVCGRSVFSSRGHQGTGAGVSRVDRSLGHRCGTNYAKLLAIACCASVRSRHDANPPVMTAGLYHMRVLKHVPVLYFVLMFEDTENSSDLMWSFAPVRLIDVTPLRHHNQGREAVPLTSAC